MLGRDIIKVQVQEDSIRLIALCFLCILRLTEIARPEKKNKMPARINGKIFYVF
jgi:hypothetical protein